MACTTTLTFDEKDYLNDLLGWHYLKIGMYQSKYFGFNDYHVEDYKIDNCIWLGNKKLFIPIDIEVAPNWTENKYPYRDFLIKQKKYHDYRHMKPLLLRFSNCGKYVAIAPFKAFDSKLPKVIHTNNRGDYVENYYTHTWGIYFIETINLGLFFDYFYQIKDYNIDNVDKSLLLDWKDLTKPFYN